MPSYAYLINSLRAVLASPIATCRILHMVGPSSLAMKPGNIGYMGVPEQARQEILSEFGSSSTRAFTVRGQFTSDGRPRMFLNASAFANGLGGLVSDMAHEFVHGANVKGVKPPWYKPWQDDLSFDPKH